MNSQWQFQKAPRGWERVIDSICDGVVWIAQLAVAVFAILFMLKCCAEGSQEAPSQADLLATLSSIQRIEVARDAALLDLKQQLTKARDATNVVQTKADALAKDDDAQMNRANAAEIKQRATAVQLERVMRHLNVIMLAFATMAAAFLFSHLMGMFTGVPYAVFIEAGLSLAFGALVWGAMAKLFGII